MYRDLGRSVKRTRRKQLVRGPPPVLAAPNHEWAVDCASDVAASGRRRESLAWFTATRWNVWRFRWTLRGRTPEPAHEEGLI